MPETDWRDVLKAYMRRVVKFEGVDFILGYEHFGEGMAGKLTPKQLRALVEIASELKAERSE